MLVLIRLHSTGDYYYTFFGLGIIYSYCFTINFFCCNETVYNLGATKAGTGFEMDYFL